MDNTKPWVYRALGAAFIAAGGVMGGVNIAHLGAQTSSQSYQDRLTLLQNGRGHDAEDIRLTCDQSRWAVAASIPQSATDNQLIADRKSRTAPLNGEQYAACISSKTTYKIDEIRAEGNQSALTRIWQKTNMPDIVSPLALMMVGGVLMLTGRKAEELEEATKLSERAARIHHKL